MDRVSSLQTVPFEISKKVDEISLILDNGAELDERNEDGKVLIRKERKLKFKERSLILFDNQCILVMNATNPRPKKIFFLEACTITQYQGDSFSFLIKDHVHKRSYVVKWNAPNSTPLDNSQVNLLPTEYNAQKPPPIVDFLRNFTFNHSSTSTLSSSDFSVIQYKSNFSMENSTENLRQLKPLSWLYKFTLTYPWQGPRRYLPVVAQIVMILNVIMLCLVSAQQPDQIAWNIPFLLYAVISIYNHYFLSQFLRTQHFEYMISVGLSRKKTMSHIQKFNRLGSISLGVFCFVFVILISFFLYTQYTTLPRTYFYLSAVSNFVTLALNLPSTVISFMSFALVVRIHVVSVSFISTLGKRMVSTNTLAPTVLYTHIIHQQHLINRTVKRTNGLFLDIFLIFACFFIVEIFHITRLSSTDIGDILMSVVLILMAFYVLLIVAMPASRLNLICDQTYNQIMFLCNFYQRNELANQNDKEIANYKKLVFMLEKMNLGYFLFDQIKVTFGWVASILYIFGGIAVFIFAQSSLFKK
eukprot:TRINITY_DN3635_c0_g1_i1.p1 TRINITY_DN3635_c0_g1~~TRINITY_DN3635_c0_g1_i1.p1  ORF type:complete len:561 (+),score=72.80 TRINITY_DN3635_c0_g1_i1:99-1685(+)